MDSLAHIHVRGVREIDALELEEHMPKGAVQKAIRLPTRTHAGEHGDFGMITVIVVVSGAAALRALSIWMAKKVDRETTTTEWSLTQHPDGTVIASFHQSVERSSTQAPNADDIKSIEARLSKLLRPLLDE